MKSRIAKSGINLDRSLQELLKGGNFYTLGKEQQENLAPEIHEVPTGNVLGSNVSHLTSAKIFTQFAQMQTHLSKICLSYHLRN